LFKEYPWVKFVLIGFGGVVFLGILLAYLLASSSVKQVPEKTIEKVSSGQPQAVLIANVTGQQVSVYWTSQKEGHATVYMNGQRYFDDRGSQVMDRVHQVTIGDLQPEKEYQIMLCANYECSKNSKDWFGLSDKASKLYNPFLKQEAQIVQGGKALTVRTGTKLHINSKSMKLAKGQIDGSPDNGFIVVSLENQGGETSSFLASLIGDNEGWAFDLANARDGQNQEFFEANNNTQVNYEVVFPDGVTMSQQESLQGFTEKPIKVQLM
jgi:hypothetical protein